MSDTSIQPRESVSLSVGCSASAVPAHPFRYPVTAGSLIGTGLPLSFCQTIRTTALRRGTLTFSTLRRAGSDSIAPR